MPDLIRVDESDGSFSVTFCSGELPADEGHEPNGYLWEGLLRYLAPELADQVELGSEGGMFAAHRDHDMIRRVQEILRSYVNDGQRAATAITSAEAVGFQFDD